MPTNTGEFDWTSLIAPFLGGLAGYAGGGNTTDVRTQTMTPEMQGQWNAYRDFANNVANRPYESTVAPFSQDQYLAMDLLRGYSGGGAEQRAGSYAMQQFLNGGNRNQYANGTPESQAGSQALMDFMSGGRSNPYSIDYGTNNYIDSNPFLQSGNQNQYSGMNNPYFNSVLRRTNDEVMNRMNTGAFSSGSFGNSGVAKQAAQAVADTAGNLGYQQYQNSANLAENALNRTAGAFQQQGSLGESAAQRALQGSNLQAQLGESGLQRQANMIPLALQYAQFPALYEENALNRQASMIPQALGYQNQLLNNVSALMQSGGMQQNLGQQEINNRWNYPVQQLQYMGMPLGFGQNTGSTSTTQQGNPWASALGGGLLGLQFGNNLFNGTGSGQPK